MYKHNIRVIHKGRPHEGGWGLANADACRLAACVNFACKKPNFANVKGGGGGGGGGGGRRSEKWKFFADVRYGWPHSWQCNTCCNASTR